MRVLMVIIVCLAMIGCSTVDIERTIQTRKTTVKKKNAVKPNQKVVVKEKATPSKVAHKKKKELWHKIGKCRPLSISKMKGFYAVKLLLNNGKRVVTSCELSENGYFVLLYEGQYLKFFNDYENSDLLSSNPIMPDQYTIYPSLYGQNLMKQRPTSTVTLIAVRTNGKSPNLIAVYLRRLNKYRKVVLFCKNLKNGVLIDLGVDGIYALKLRKEAFQYGTYYCRGQCKFVRIN